MFYWIIVFFVIALICGVFGFAGIATASAAVAKVLFFVFTGFFAVTVAAQLVRSGRTSA